MTIMLPARDSFPMRLWAKATAQVWSAQSIDFASDRVAWATASAEERRGIWQVVSLFLRGERAVSRNLLPLIQRVSAEERLEEELFLTSFLADEARHVDLFCRFCEQIGGGPGEPAPLPSYDRLLEEDLTPALQELALSGSPEAQVRAAVAFHMVVEGVMAQAGLYLLRRMLGRRNVLPSLQLAIRLVHRDEARHIAYGVFLLCRLVIEHGNRAYGAFLKRMTALKAPTEQFAQELMDALGRDNAFGIKAEELAEFSQRQFASRAGRIVRARTQSLRELQLEGV